MLGPTLTSPAKQDRETATNQTTTHCNYRQDNPTPVGSLLYQQPHRNQQTHENRR